MKPSLPMRHAIRLSALMYCLLVSVVAQNSQNQPLGDVARKAREERAAKDHIGAKHVLNEENPVHGSILSVHACKKLPCSSLTIRVPVNTLLNQKWANGAVVISLKAPEDKEHTIRVFGADLLDAEDIVQAKQLFLKEWFSRPYFFGQAARFQFDDEIQVDGYEAVITHFTVANKVANYRGLALVAEVPTGTLAYACVFRDEDSGDATSICEGILNSARIDVPREYKPYSEPSDPDPPHCWDCHDNDNPDLR